VAPGARQANPLYIEESHTRFRIAARHRRVVGAASTRPFAVSREDADELARLIDDSTTSKALARRARVVLLSGQGCGAKQIADQLGFTQLTVYKWRRRYRVNGITGLLDLARPGQPRKLSGKTRSRIVALTRHTIPADATHWSIRRMARFAQVTEHQVRRIWQDEGLKTALEVAAVDRGDGMRLDDLVGVCLAPRLSLAVFETGIPGASFMSSSELARGRRLEPGRRGRANVYTLFDSAVRRPEVDTTGPLLEDFLARVAFGVHEDTRLFVSLVDGSRTALNSIRSLLRVSALEIEQLATVGQWLFDLERRCWELETLHAEEARRGVLGFRRSIRAFVATHRAAKGNTPFVWAVKEREPQSDSDSSSS